MVFYHNNQLNAVGLFDYDQTYSSAGPSSAMLASATSDYSGITNAGNGYLHGHQHAPQVNYGFGVRPVEPERFITSTSGNQDQERKDEAKLETEVKKHTAQIQTKSEAKSPTWKRVLKKVKGSLVVKLKVGHRGINKKQAETHVLPMSDMQAETSMLPMNGITNMPAGVDMLQTNNMQLGGLTLPGNNLFSGMSTPAYWAQTHQFLYPGQAQATQPSQSLSPEEKRYNRNHVVCNNFLVDEHYDIKATVGPDLSPEAKRFNRNHVISDGVMFDEYNDVRATDEELLPLGDIITPESDPFHGGYFSQDLSDLHGQAQGLLDLSQEDSNIFSSFTDYDAHLGSH